MNRPIKFRAWDKIDNLLLDCVEINFHQKWVALVYNNGEGGELQQRKFGDIELMQFTGLTDKNSKEIYEGDILQYQAQWINGGTHGDVTENLEVRFNDGAFTTKLELLGNGLRRREMIVIGNIYENPELLK
mgnify:CR=1 FL=1